MVEVEVREIVAEPVTPFNMLRQILLLVLPGLGLCHPRLAGADFLLGAGSRTHLPLLLFKKQYGIPAVVCMSPPLFLRNRFDLCFVPEHDGLLERKNIIQTIGAPNCSRNKSLHRDDHGLILLGGIDAKSHRWDSAEIGDMVRQIVRKENQKHWTISSSPRTPVETVKILVNLAADFPNVNFFNYKETGPGWIEEQYDTCSVVWVTSDSISMIYEALTAGCKVGILPMQWLRKDSKFKRNEDLLLKKGLVKSLSSWMQGDAMWQENVELNEAQLCAERILKKWSPKN
ncbi:MAG: mitochondrial fission ELM1 family protein [Desulforhopalus sp.]|nr:mitochondrial fission ELM1 family protein [Desulforhopalus sp.]